MDERLKLKARILAVFWERKEFGQDVDGYWYWWPSVNHGSLSAQDLILIAELLNEANRRWDNIVKAI